MDVTHIGLFLFFVVLPKVAKTSKSVSLSCVIVTGIAALTLANVNNALVNLTIDF